MGKFKVGDKATVYNACIHYCRGVSSAYIGQVVKIVEINGDKCLVTHKYSTGVCAETRLCNLKPYKEQEQSNG